MFSSFGSAIQKRTGGIYIVSGGGSSGIDVNQSTLGISSSTVLSGSNRTLTLQLKNANGVNITTGGATIVASKSGGTATGTLSSVTDNGDGTYTWTYTGILTGTAQTFSCTINGVAFGNTKPTCAVTPGAIDITVSTVSIGSSTKAAGTTTTLTLQAKDAAGNNLTAGGSTVAFNHSGGTSVITIGSVTDNNNGTYTATVTCTTAGTATTFSATIGGQSVTTSMPTLTVLTTVVFSADWSNSIGTGAAALTDGSRWDGSYNGNSVIQVVADPTGSAPTTNVFRVSNLSPTVKSGWVEKSGLWPSPQIGESRYWRIYLYNATSDAAGNVPLDNSYHPVEYAATGGGNDSDESWNLLLGSKTDGTFPFKFAPTKAAYPKSRWIPSSAHNVQAYLSKNAWIRIEWKLTKTGTNAYTLDARIYNAANVLLFDSSTIRDASIDLTMAASGTGLLMTDAYMGYFRVGTNGGSEWSAIPSTQYIYWTGFCVRSDTWCGPYSGGQ